MHAALTHLEALQILLSQGPTEARTAALTSLGGQPSLTVANAFALIEELEPGTALAAGARERREKMLPTLTSVQPLADEAVLAAFRDPHPSYRIIAGLGEGAAGRVFVALQTGMRRMVALKVFTAGVGEGGTRFGRAGDSMLRQRFQRASQAMGRLLHPNLQTIFDAGTIRGMAFRTQELVDGKNLQQLVASEGRVEPMRAARLIGQLAEGLVAAHAAGVTHRAIKPANILVDRHGHAKLADFLASGMAPAPATAQDMLAGALSYRAPEAETEDAGELGDLFALGAALFHILAGSAPFTATSAPTLPQNVEAPQALKDLVHALLQPDPKARPQSAMEVAQVCRTVAGREPLVVVSASASPFMSGDASPAQVGPSSAELAAITRANEMRAELAEAQSQHAITQNALSASQAQVVHLRTELNEMKTALASLTATGGDDANAARAATAQAQAELAAAKAELAAAKAAAEQAVADLAAAHEAAAANQSELANARAAVATAQTELAVAKAASASALADLAAASSPAAPLADDSALAAEYAILMESKSELEAKVSSLTAQLEASQAVAAQAHSELAEVKASQGEAWASAPAAAENPQLEAELTDVKIALAQAQENANRFKLDVEALQAALDAANLAATEAENELAAVKAAPPPGDGALQDELASARASISLLEGKLAQYKNVPTEEELAEVAAELASAKSAAEQAQRELAAMRNAPAAPEVDVSGLKQELEAAKNAATQAHADLAISRAAMSTAQQEAEELKAEIEKLRSASATWQLSTTPGAQDEVVDRLTMEVANLKAANIQAQRAATQAQNDLAALKASGGQGDATMAEEIIVLKSQLIMANKAAAQAQQELAAVKPGGAGAAAGTDAALVGEQAKLRAELAEARKLATQAQAELAALKAAASQDEDAVGHELAQLRSAAVRAQDAASRGHAEIKQLKDQLAKTEAELAEARGAVMEAITEIEKKDAEIGSLREGGGGVSRASMGGAGNPLEETQAGAAPAAQKTVLLVDDSHQVLRLLGSLLTNGGYKVLTADSPLEAAELMKSHAGFINLLMTDVVFPDGETGRDLITLSRKLYPDIPIVAMSGQLALEARTSVLSAGADAFVPKPLEPNEVLAVVQRACAASSRSLLLVDDDRLIRLVLSRLFENNGFKVRAASNLDEAKAQIEQKQPDVVVCDLKVREESGLDLLQFVRDTGSKKPFIMLSASPDPESVIQAYRLKVHDFIIKSDDMRILLTAVEAAVGGTPPPTVSSPPIS